MTDTNKIPVSDGDGAVEISQRPGEFAPGLQRVAAYDVSVGIVGIEADRAVEVSRRPVEVAPAEPHRRAIDEKCCR